MFCFISFRSDPVHSCSVVDIQYSYSFKVCTAFEYTSVCVCITYTVQIGMATCSWTNFYQFELWYGICDAIQLNGAIEWFTRETDRIALLCSFSRLSFRTSIQISKCLCFHQCRNENAHTHIFKLCIARRLMWKCQERDILRIDHTKSKRKAPITTYIELADKRHYDYKRDQVSQ